MTLDPVTRGFLKDTGKMTEPVKLTAADEKFIESVVRQANQKKLDEANKAKEQAK